MKFLTSLIEKISILSLDVVAGVVGGCWMFARQMQVHISWPQYVVLGSSVWLIYTIDHLLDARQASTLVTLRHRFHHQHRLALVIVSIVVFFCTAYIAFAWLPLRVIWFGVVVGGCMAVYLLLIHVFDKKYFWKELWVTTLYMAGVWGSVAIRSTQVRLIDWFAVCVYFILIFQDVLMLAWYEVEEDHQQHLFSSVHRRGEANVYVLLRVLITIGVLGCVLGWWLFAETRIDQWVWGILWIIAGVLAAITYFPARFRRGYLYRFLGDGILVLPWVIVWVDT